MGSEKGVQLLRAVVVLGLGALIQATIGRMIRPFGGEIDLVLLIIVISCLWSDVDRLVVWSLIGGAFLDLFSAASFGTSMLALGVVAVFLSWIAEYVRRSHPIALIFLVPLATVTFNLVLSIVLRALGWSVDYPAMVALVVLPNSLANLIATPFVYLAIRLARGRTRLALRII